MAKRVKNSSKKVHKASSKKSSGLERFFTFPALVIAAFIILSVVTFYLIAKPSHGVEGVSTSTLYEDVSDADYNSASLSKGDNGAAKFLNLRIFKDTNGNGKRDSGESYLLKDYTVVINGVTKTKTQKAGNGWNHVDLGQECNTIKFGANIKGYNYSGMVYTDKEGLNHNTKEKTISYCGGQTYGAGWNRFVSFGLKPI